MLAMGWIAVTLLGQEPPQAKVEALMATSVEQQRAAVRRQTARPEGADGFFALPVFLLSPPQSLGARILAATDAGCEALADAELRPLAAEAAEVAGVKADWLLTLVAEKSQGRPCALSPAGAAGLMQLGPAAIDLLHVANPFDPRENLTAGARWIARLVADHHGDFAAARAAYDGTPDGKEPASAQVLTPATVSSEPPMRPAGPAASQKQPPAADKK